MPVPGRVEYQTKAIWRPDRNTVEGIITIAHEGGHVLEDADDLIADLETALEAV